MTLDRKKSLVDALLAAEGRIKEHDWSGTTATDLLDLYQKHGTWTAAARAIGGSPTHIYRLRRRFGLS